MSSLTLESLRALIAHETAPCLSIYVSSRASASTEVQLRWKALLKDVRAAFARFDPAFDAEPVIARLTDVDLAPVDGEGATHAIFQSGNSMVVHRLPIAIEDNVTVSRSFHLRPLLEFVGSGQQYYLLNLSHGRVSFFQGGAGGLVALAVPNLPAMSAQEAGATHRDRYVSPRSGGPHSTSVWHGQGKDERVAEEDELKFVRAIDRSLTEFLRDEKAPLVVASTEKLFSAFLGHCRYPYVLKQPVHGSFANSSIEELHAKAWPLVAAHAQAREQEFLDRHRDAPAREHVTNELSAIARYAVQGRVRELLIDRNAHAWGRMDRSTGALDVHLGAQAAQDDDVLDNIAGAVLMRGGHIHSVDTARMPEKSPVAALLRW